MHLGKAKEEIYHPSRKRRVKSPCLVVHLGKAKEEDQYPLIKRRVKSPCLEVPLAPPRKRRVKSPCLEAGRASQRSPCLEVEARCVYDCAECSLLLLILCASLKRVQICFLQKGGGSGYSKKVRAHFRKKLSSDIVLMLWSLAHSSLFILERRVKKELMDSLTAAQRVTGKAVKNQKS